MKVATTAVIQKDNKILIGRRVRDGFWELPGGKIDPGETPEECILREIKEEIGIDVRIDQLICKLEGTYRDISMRVFAFLTSWVSGEEKDHVHREIKWILPDELQQYPFIEEDLIVFKHHYSNIK